MASAIAKNVPAAAEGGGRSARRPAAVVIVAVLVVACIAAFSITAADTSNPGASWALQRSSDASGLPAENTRYNVTVWMPTHTDWEREYLVKDLIGAAAQGNVTMRLQNVLSDFNRDRDEDRINDPNTVNIVVIHGRFEDDKKCHSTIIEKVQYYQPAVVFVTSDEQAWTRCVNAKLSRIAPVVLRHYSYQSHRMDPQPNVFNIPLGTMNRQVFPARDAMVKASQREWIWAFAGAAKQDRRQILSAFQQKFPNRHRAEIDSQPSLPMTEVADIYARAAFVPNGRGFVSLDCFRLYEASRAGAIPVMLAPIEEAERTFGHFLGSDGSMPPWIVSESADEAVKSAAKLLESPAELDARQAAVLDWWDNVTRATVATIRHAITADYARRQRLAQLREDFARAGKHEVAAWFDANVPRTTPAPIATPGPTNSVPQDADPMATEAAPLLEGARHQRLHNNGIRNVPRRGGFSKGL